VDGLAWVFQGDVVNKTGSGAASDGGVERRDDARAENGVLVSLVDVFVDGSAVLAGWVSFCDQQQEDKERARGVTEETQLSSGFGGEHRKK